MMKPTLLDLTLPRTLQIWVKQFEKSKWRGARIEGWLFEGQAARRSAEQRLAAAGVQARLRSAYKPLLHYFLEEIDLATLAAVRIRYPVHRHASARRFLLEAYPLAALLAPCDVEFLPGDEQLAYQLDLTLRDGRPLRASVAAPNRVHIDHLGTTQLSPTGWLRAQQEGDPKPRLDRAEQTDYEQLFERVLETIEQHPWPAQEPYFERLNIRVDLPGFEQALALQHEVVSSLEALHEDLYFSLLEIFQRRSGRPENDRRLQPGQIVPDVRASNAAPRVRIFFSPFDVQTQDQLGASRPSVEQAIETLERAVHPQRIAAELERLTGQRIAAVSRQGRAVLGLYQAGPGAAVLISGGQHANETSGVVGALRAAQTLAARGNANFALIALENPDGYALQRELCAQHPHHMLHAARYSALGDDIEYREQAPLYERAAREQALVLSGAQLHINLHGYPAHEWTRPLCGYVPRGFDLWTLPKGFFLILRHHPGWQAEGRALLEQVCAAIIKVPGLRAFNARQMKLYQQHAGALSFEVLHGVACSLSESSRPGAPVTLITEFPDETVEGQAFRFAHQVQMQAALAATSAWQTLARPRSDPHSNPAF